jgi:hypothetical protein
MALRIGLDATSLDRMYGSGQFRYVIDLVRGLASMRPPVEFTFLGSRPAPPSESADAFESPACNTGT